MCAGVFATLLAAGYAGAALAGEDDGDNDREFVRAGPGHGNMGNRGAQKPADKPEKPAHPEHPAHPNHPARGLNPNNVSLCDDPTLELVGPVGQSGKSQVAHTNFLPAVQSTGLPAEADDWARMMYFWVGSTFDFVFNAHRLEPATLWTLVAIAGDGTGICLGNGTVNGGGQLHILGSVDPEANFPTDLDPFAPRTEATVDATVQLIPTATVDCTTGAITPGEGNMLVSSFGVRFVDVDVLTCPAPPPPP
jgi:hypothetical protein